VAPGAVANAELGQVALAVARREADEVAVLGMRRVEFVAIADIAGAPAALADPSGRAGRVVARA